MAIQSVKPFEESPTSRVIADIGKRSKA